MELIRIIEKELKIKAKIKYAKIKPGDMVETCADIEHSIKNLNYNPKTKIQTGVLQLIKWYKEYYGF